MTNQGRLRRLRDAANRYRADISTASATIATQRQKATDAASAAERTKVGTTARTKQRAAARATKSANEAEKKRAAAEKKLADIEREISKVQARYDKERDTTQAKALADLRKKADEASAKFRPRWDAGSPSSIAMPRLETHASDIFLSHASEDKDEIARPLKIALEERGISVWFDEIKIEVGQSIRQAIEAGIARCHFGVVILSPHFFARQWTQAELDGLFMRKMASGQNLILPVWHRVSMDEVIQHSPMLVGIAALNSATMTIDEMADNLSNAVRAGRAAL